MATMIPIQTITVGSGGLSSVTFNSIPQNFTDLHIKMSTRSSGGGNGLLGAVRFNNDSGNNYSDKYFYTDTFGGSTGAGNHSANTFGYAVSSPGPSQNQYYFSNNIMYIPNYTLSRWKGYHCDGMGEGDLVASYGAVLSGLWMNTAAITDITLFPGGGFNFVQNSVFTLYGIKSS